MIKLEQSVVVREVKSRKDLRAFIHLPARVHASNPNWLPPIYVDEWNFFNPNKNPSFSHCDTILLLAYNGEQPVGRIMGIIHRTYNEAHNERTARFGYLECFNHSEIAFALLTYIEDWARSMGMTKLIGSYGFSDKDPQGLLVEGFEHMPIIDSACNMPYLVNLVEELGYSKEFDCLSYRFDLSTGLAESYSRIAARVETNNGFTFVEFNNRRGLKPYIIPLLRMVNDTYSHLYGFVPMDEREMRALAKRYMPIIEARYVKIVLKGERIVGFVLGLPNFTQGMQRAKGKLFPFGLLYILRSMRSTNQLDLMLGAVDKDYRGRGVEIALALRLFDSCRKNGLTVVETHLVLESNTQMISELERAKCILHKRFRVFGKSLI